MYCHTLFTSFEEPQSLGSIKVNSIFFVHDRWMNCHVVFFSVQMLIKLVFIEVRKKIYFTTANNSIEIFRWEFQDGKEIVTNILEFSYFRNWEWFSRKLRLKFKIQKFSYSKYGFKLKVSSPEVFIMGFSL